MADFLTTVSQTYRKATSNDGLLSISEPAKPKPVLEPKVQFQGASPEEALEVLKSQPDYITLVSVLKYLRKGTKGNESFDIRVPDPKSAQIIHVLVTEILPNYWTVLQESSGDHSSRDAELLLACLQSITGINAVLTYLKALIREAKADSKGLQHSHAVFNLSFTLDLLNRLLQADDKVKQIWGSISSLENPAQLRPLRHEFLSLFTSGKLISVSAEAEDLCRQVNKIDEPFWMADGKRYVDWLSRNMVTWARSGISDDELKLCAETSARAMKLPYSETIIKAIFTELILRDEDGTALFAQLINHVPTLEQRKWLQIILKLLSDMYLNSVDTSSATEDCPTVCAAAGALKAVLGSSETQKKNLLVWLTSASGAGVGESCGIRRAAVAALADDKEAISDLLEKSLSQFGDQLYIKHTPALQQEAHAQVLLLSAGYTHRLAPIKLTILLRSGSYLNAVSNRIDVLHSRARFLGMVVGEALSGLVHGKETKLDFKMDEMDTEEAQWYKSLVQVSDKIGPLDPLRVSLGPRMPEKAPKKAKPTKKHASRPGNVPQQTGFIIEEIEDDEEQDPDLVPYAKPDSDAEDSDDDPTLINRDKPKAPVYIRDLISYLRDTESYDKQKLALATAPALIRRKANYGTEVSSHAEELATLLVGLQDKFDMEDFHNLRLQGMVAIVVAQPKKMGPWFAKTFFDGDYSLGQRASVLMVLGLSGRELAGFETSNYAMAAQFPSKKLPSKVENHYALPETSASRSQSLGTNLKSLPPTALDNLAQSLSQTFLAPLAAEAADAATGPDALKLSSFTSRLQSQQASKTKFKSKSKCPGVRSIPNTTASLLSTSFFSPLAARFLAATRSSSLSSRDIVFQPYLLTQYLTTLALLLHAAGPSTLALPQMTAELWDLLLSVRGRCPGELGVTRAVLLGFAALLDVNEEGDGSLRGLCERHGRETVETVEWVGGVFENTPGGGSDGEENQVKMLAAGVLIRLREAVERYQALLMGDLIGYS